MVSTTVPTAVPSTSFPTIFLSTRSVLHSSAVRHRHDVQLKGANQIFSSNIPPPFAPTVERILARTDPTNETRQIGESAASCTERALKNEVRIAQEQMIKNQAVRNIPVAQSKEYYHEAESDGETVNSLLDEFDNAYTGFVNMKLVSSVFPFEIVFFFACQRRLFDDAGENDSKLEFKISMSCCIIQRSDL